MEIISLFDHSITTYFLASAIFFYFLLYNSLLRRRLSRLPPGPKPFPVLGNLPHLGPFPHHSLAALAKFHGPLMHLWLGSKNVVVASSAAVAEQFLKTHDLNFASRPPISAGKHIGYNFQGMVWAPYGKLWRTLRKISQIHLFSAKALDDFRNVRQEEVDAMIRALAKVDREEVELGKHLNVCTANALGRAILGKRVFEEGSGKAGEFKDMVLELMTVSGEFNIGDFIPVLDWLDLQGITRKMKKIHKRLDTFAGGILEEHKAALRANETDHHSDMLSLLISLKDESGGKCNKLTDTEIKALVSDLFIAGTDTSSSTTEWAIAELIRHPFIMAKVQEEIDSVVGPNRLVTEADLSSLTYFQAVMKEVFRLHPPTPLSIPRMSIESCEINDYHIPKNSTLLVNIWAIGRDPNAWPNPLKFCPDRFLIGGERPNVDLRGNDFEVIPFGAGRRICAGMNLGLRIVQIMTATLVHAFDWELTDGQKPEKLNMEEAFGLTLQRKVPLVAYPKHRLSSQVYNI